MNALRFAFTLLAFAAAARALTVPVAQDTYSTPAGLLVPAYGKQTTIRVGGGRAALVRFDLSDLAVVPTAIQPGNVKAATLRFFVISAKPGADVGIVAVTADWQETIASKLPLPFPATGATVATIGAAQFVGKKFISVDVTAAVISALHSGSDFGFALTCTDPKAKIVIASKEGPATGHSAQLDIEANTGADANGNATFAGSVNAASFGASGAIVSGSVSTAALAADTGYFTQGLSGADATFGGPLSVSTAFVVEPRPGNAPGTPGANIFIGSGAGAANTNGQNNTYVGKDAGAAGTGLGCTGNSFFGFKSGALNTSGSNSFFGASSGANNTSGSGNSFFGFLAGLQNTTGFNNSFFGYVAGRDNTTGTFNTFMGRFCGAATTTGSYNVFAGSHAGEDNTTGTQNAFFGHAAGSANTDGASNSLLGYRAGANSITGANNTFVGGLAGLNATSESNNTLVGSKAEITAGVTNATAIGANAKVGISNAVVLGDDCRVGIGTSAPNAMLQVNGSLSLPIRTSNALLTNLGDADYVLVNTFNGAGISLPSASGNKGRIYVVKNRAATAATLGTNPATQLIDGSNTLSIATNITAVVICDGANWFRIN